MIENKFVLCFEIEETNGHMLRLTDKASEIRVENKIFTPHSGLEFNTTILDESGENEATIKGFFEDEGLNKNFNVNGASVAIYIFSDSGLKNWRKYLCTKYIENEISFIMTLKSITFLYGQEIIGLYSKSCRANFGDQKCGINLEEFSGEKCDKTLTMCTNRYKNAVNFRGEPFIPTYEYFNNLNE